ncbi:MAG: hypothetical protein IBJ07_12105 [Rhizobiaceae bacterium]|nr:hypothetical protein [Rhizobiaceae bacterium]
MADYFTQFWFVLDVGTPVDGARAPDALCAEAAGTDPHSDAFVLWIDPAPGDSDPCMRDDGRGDPQRVIDFVPRCVDAFALAGRWGVQWMSTCSRPRVNTFGVGAHVLHLGRCDMVERIGKHAWFDDTIRGGRP